MWVLRPKPRSSTKVSSEAAAAAALPLVGGLLGGEGGLPLVGSLLGGEGGLPLVGGLLGGEGGLPLVGGLLGGEGGALGILGGDDGGLPLVGGILGEEGLLGGEMLDVVTDTTLSCDAAIPQVLYMLIGEVTEAVCEPFSYGIFGLLGSL